MDALIDLSPAAPCPQKFNLAAYVLSAASKTPHKIALTVYEAGIARRYSYAQMAQAVFGAATGLRQAGIRAGDRVMLRIGNTVDFPVCFLALAALDAIAMPCSIALTDREVKVLVGKTMPKAMICDPEFGLPGFGGLTLDSQRGAEIPKPFPCAPDLGRSQSARIYHFHLRHIWPAAGCFACPSRGLGAPDDVGWLVQPDTGRCHDACRRLELDLYIGNGIDGPLGDWGQRRHPQYARPG